MADRSGLAFVQLGYLWEFENRKVSFLAGVWEGDG